MNARSLPAAQHRAPRAIAIALVLLGAALAAASAASADFELGSDLRLGHAVHRTAVGPFAAWLVVASLVAIAVLATIDAVRAAQALAVLAGVAALVALLAVGYVAIASRSHVDHAMEAVPVVVLFFSVPSFVVSVLLRESAHTMPDAAHRGEPPGDQGIE